MVLGLWINETEGKHTWMQIFDEIRSRGVQGCGLYLHGWSQWLEEGARSIFSGDCCSTLHRSPDLEIHCGIFLEQKP